MRNEIEPLLVTKKCCSTMLGISVRSVDYLLAQKKLQGRRLGRRVLVTVKSIRSLAAADSPAPICPHTRTGGERD